MWPEWSERTGLLSFIEGDLGQFRLHKIDIHSEETLANWHEIIAQQLQGSEGCLSPETREFLGSHRHAVENDTLFFEFASRLWSLDLCTFHLSSQPAPGSVARRESRAPLPDFAAHYWTRRGYLASEALVPGQASPDGRMIATIRDSNISISLAGAPGADRLLTRDGCEARYWDIEAPRVKADSGRRLRERAITAWAPDSCALVAYQRDVERITKLPCVDWLTSPPTVRMHPWPLTGESLDHVSPMFIEIQSGSRLPIALPETDNRYIQLLGWLPDSSAAILISYTRAFDVVEVWVASRASGSCINLLTERVDTFVKLHAEAVFSGDHGFQLLPDGSGFLWISTRDGWAHIYLYDMGGNCLAQLTQGAWPVQALCRVGMDRFVYFTGSPDQNRPYDVHVCRVSLAGGDVERLTVAVGIHEPIFDSAATAFIDTHSAVDRPLITELRRSDGRLLKTLSRMDTSSLIAVGYQPPMEFTVRSADNNHELWGVVYVPSNFKPGNSYPIVQYVYGGPQTVETPRFFAADPSISPSMLHLWAIAQLGYAVVCLDGRGTPGRSKTFQDAVFNHWGVGVADHAAAIEQLCARFPWLDRRRVGIIGHSWGGYHATAALLYAPTVYRAAVAYAPHYFPMDSACYEAYLGSPAKRPEIYARADLSSELSKISGHLMIVAGTADLDFDNAVKMTRALIDARVEHEFVLVPNAPHIFSGRDEEYLLMKVRAWLERYVKYA